MKIKFNVEIECKNIEQAVTLQEFFGYWNYLCSIGKSQFVAFYVDGDGNFKPNCKYNCSKKLPKLNAQLLNVIMRNPKTHKAEQFFDFGYLDIKEGNK